MSKAKAMPADDVEDGVTDQIKDLTARAEAAEALRPRSGFLNNWNDE